jgi:hypothetical protein
MSRKTLTRIGLAVLAAGLAGLCFHAFRPPQDAVATSPGQSPVTFQGGPGDTAATAVIIRGAADGVAGVAAEYRYLTGKFGERNRAWRLKRQQLWQQNGRVYDVMHLELAEGSRRTIYFDITEFSGKN